MKRNTLPLVIGPRESTQKTLDSVFRFTFDESGDQIIERNNFKACDKINEGDTDFIRIDPKTTDGLAPVNYPGLGVLIPDDSSYKLDCQCGVRLDPSSYGEKVEFTCTYYEENLNIPFALADNTTFVGLVFFQSSGNIGCEWFNGAGADFIDFICTAIDNSFLKMTCSWENEVFTYEYELTYWDGDSWETVSDTVVADHSGVEFATTNGAVPIFTQSSKSPSLGAYSAPCTFYYCQINHVDEPYFEITAPNGGETFEAGASTNITWTSGAGPSRFVQLDYSIDGGISWSHISTNEDEDGSYSWTVPNVATEQARVRVVDVLIDDIFDMSDANFEIQYSITVTSPTSATNWKWGTAQNVTWTTKGVSGNVKIELSRDAGTTWETIAASTPNDGTYEWTIPTGEQSIRGTDNIIRVSSVNDPTLYDDSEQFTVSVTG